MPRSVGEKMRRDRLNSLLATLAEEVPFIANSYRRLDKTAILRLTVSYMKLYHGKSYQILYRGILMTFWLALPTSDHGFWGPVLLDVEFNS